MHVNKELEEIGALLEAAPELLKPGGRLVAISFHSLEDRLVKDAMREGAQAGIWEILMRKPLTATDAEVERNPRARSAKLRAAQKLSAAQEQQASPLGRRNKYPVMTKAPFSKEQARRK